MPLYEYVCQRCRRRFEVLQRVGEGSEGLVCPDCGASELEKQFSTFAGTSSTSGATASRASTCGSGAFT